MIPLYQLREVEFHYNHAEVPALKVSALDIQAGTVTAVIGPNGAGKSTLIHLLAFVHAPTRGELRFEGEDSRSRPLRTLRRRVGLVPQNPYLFHDSVAANVEIGLRLRGVAADKRRALTQTALEQMRLDKLAPRPARELSGGEAQKVAIARILVLEPEVLLLDEPFTYLDKKMCAELEELIVTIREHRAQTIVFSSHDHLRAHALADQIVSLFDGRIAPASLINHFQGKLDEELGRFDTGKICIHVPDGRMSGTHLAIEASQIVLSRERLHSSMRNMFRGRVTGLHEDNGRIRVTVQAGENFQAVVTRSALQELGIALGEDVYISFKSTAVRVF